MNKKMTIKLIALLIIFSLLPIHTMIGYADTSDYNYNDYSALLAFLNTNSKIQGKTNAHILGLDANDPEKWKVAWTPEKPRQVVSIEWKVSNKSRDCAGSLIISGFQKLQRLWFLGGDLKQVTITRNPALYLFCLGYTKAEAITVTGNLSLKALDFDSTTTKNMNFDGASLETLRTSTLGGKNLDGGTMPNLKKLELFLIESNTVDLSKNNKLNWLLVSQCENLNTLKLGSHPDLEMFYIDSSAIKGLDLTGATGLKIFECKGNPALTELKLGSSNKALKKMKCIDNSKLEQLNIEGLPSIEELVLNNNNLKSLKIEGNDSLKALDCSSNQLTSLDVSKCKSLSSLNCSSNQMNRLVIPPNQLDSLDTVSNKFTELDVSIKGKNISLKSFGSYVSVWTDKEGPIFGSEYIDGNHFKEWKGSGFKTISKKKDVCRATGAVTATAHNTTSVYYDPMGGTGVGTFDVLCGSALKTPKAPTRKGFTFIGWYKDIACSKVWNFSKDTILSKITLYAKWTPTIKTGQKYFTVTAKPNNIKYGSVLGAGKYPKDSNAILIAQPADGYRFVSWKEGNKNVSTQVRYTFTVTGNRTLSAVFEKIKSAGTSGGSANPDNTEKDDLQKLLDALKEAM